MTAISRLRRRATALVAGAIGSALVLSGCSVYDAPLPGGPDVGDNPIKITAQFRDVLDLVPQSTVKVNDVTVGKVTKVSLKGYTAVVSMELPKSVDLPDNSTAQIRQTSLLGEKFISLAPPENPSADKLANGDVIGLDRTGRNPEVEEVFSALALLLNGGGVGQLKTIAEELNTAFDGREAEVRSVLEQIRLFVGQLDDNKGAIVAALENTNRLAAELRQQEGTIKATLDDVPAALRSIDKQRDDLIKLLDALNRLSGVGVRVIQASKESTINSLRDLAPVLDGFAKAGQNFPKSFQVFLTYPFVDEAVGRDPQVARNLHMGDYTNLSIKLDLEVADLPKLPTGPIGDACAAVRDEIIKGINDSQLPKATKDALIAQVRRAPCDQLRDPAAFLSGINQALCEAISIPGICRASNPGPGIPSITIPPLGGSLGGLTLPRADLGDGFQREPASIDPFGLTGYGLDPGIGTMLLQGVADVR